MKLKDVYKKYKGYSFEVYGRPLSQPTIPFTLLPKVKDIKECEVVELKVTDKEHEQYRFDLSGKLKGKETVKGYVRVVIK